VRSRSRSRGREGGKGGGGGGTGATPQEGRTSGSIAAEYEVDKYRARTSNHRTEMLLQRIAKEKARH
jgi:hypothetical protein